MGLRVFYAILAGFAAWALLAAYRVATGTTAELPRDPAQAVLGILALLVVVLAAFGVLRRRKRV